MGFSHLFSPSLVHSCNATCSGGNALKNSASIPPHLLGVACVRAAIGSGHLTVMAVGGGDGMVGKMWLLLLLLLTGAQFGGCRALIDVEWTRLAPHYI